MRVLRDNQNNFYLEDRGQTRKLELPEFQSIGINADFVQPGQSVDLNEAVTGRKDPIADMPPEYQALYSRLEEYLDELEKRGMAINPNIEITPDKINEFTAQAKNEIEPYYANQLKVAKDSFLTSLGYSQDVILNQEKELERKYKQTLQADASNFAEKGFAQSGQRVLSEQNLAQDTQNTIDTNRRTLGFNAGQTGREFAGLYGTSNLPTLNLQGAPRVLPGQEKFDYGTQSSPFYSLSPEVYDGLTGSQQFQERADVRNRASQLEGAYRSQLATNQQRSLTI